MQVILNFIHSMEKRPKQRNCNIHLMDNSFYLTKNVPLVKLSTLTIEQFFLFNKNKQLLSVEYLFSCMNVDNIFIFILQPASQLETLRIL